jgi:hypothetical protein
LTVAVLSAAVDDGGDVGAGAEDGGAVAVGGATAPGVVGVGEPLPAPPHPARAADSAKPAAIEVCFMRTACTGGMTPL